MKGIIVILGNKNDNLGNLSSVAIERCQLGIRELNKNHQYKLLLTGAFGDYFNTTQKPHTDYLQKYLYAHNVRKKEILGVVPSSNTIEDALYSHKIVEKHKVKDIIVVTSDFHMKRVKYIFDILFKGYRIRFAAAKTNTSSAQLQALRNHEKKAMTKLRGY